MANTDAVVTEADVRSAQAFLDSLEEEAPDALEGLTPHERRQALQLGVRGALAAVLAETRTAGYLEGLQEGRQATAHLVLDALEGEGLVRTTTRQGGPDW